MNIKDELIKYAKWYDKATMPEYAQTDEADLVQNVESYLQTEGKNIVLSDVSGCDSIKTTWDIRECFKQLRFDKNHHLGLGDIRLTIAQQEEICDLVEHFYHCR